MPVMPCQMALPMVFCPPFGTDQGRDQESTDESFQDSIVERVKSFVGGEIQLSPLECTFNPVNNGINYQAQLVPAGFLNHPQ